MNRIIHKISACTVPVIIAIGINLFILLGSAVLIEAKFVDLASAAVFIVLALILSAVFGSFYAVRKSGIKEDGFIFAVVYFLFLLLASVLKEGTVSKGELFVKQIISVFCGTILGNFLGSCQYYKLRNSGKKRARATK